MIDRESKIQTLWQVKHGIENAIEAIGRFANICMITGACR
jgi:hypothetical protein